jgi:hypothetical protein
MMHPTKATNLGNGIISILVSLGITNAVAFVTGRSFKLFYSRTSGGQTECHVQQKILSFTFSTDRLEDLRSASIQRGETGKVGEYNYTVVLSYSPGQAASTNHLFT